MRAAERTRAELLRLLVGREAGDVRSPSNARLVTRNQYTKLFRDNYGFRRKVWPGLLPFHPFEIVTARLRLRQIRVSISDRRHLTFSTFYDQARRSAFWGEFQVVCV
jgi:hypothetical protein